MALATWRALGLELALDEPESVLRERALAAAGVGAEALRGMRIARKSLDARRSGGARRLRFVFHVDLMVDAGFRSRGLERAERSGRVVRAPELGRFELERV
ncbi:MAG TPA: hypothetical protein VEI82_07995, partial [Myxococcota bacterium]|nr:hypothetical protein [Myxococcota bacterium]